MGRGVDGRVAEVRASGGIGNIVLCETARRGRIKRETAMKTILKLTAASVVALGMLGFGAEMASASGKSAAAVGSVDHGDKHDGKDKVEAPEVGDTHDATETEGVEGSSGH